MPKNVKRKICAAHDDILKLAEELRGIKLPRGYKGKVTNISFAISKVAREAKKYGQKMEDRLVEYRDSIEQLGFERDWN